MCVCVFVSVHGDHRGEVSPLAAGQIASDHSTYTGDLGEGRPGRQLQTALFYPVTLGYYHAITFIANKSCVHRQVVHVSGATVLQEALPNCRVDLLENCGHSVTMERPRKSATLITDFLSAQGFSWENTKKHS